MLRYAIGFFIIVTMAAVLAFSGVAVGVAYTAKMVFFISLPLFVLSSLFTAYTFKKEVLDKRDLDLIQHQKLN